LESTYCFRSTELTCLVRINSLVQVEEAGRVLLALLLKTNNLETEVARWIEDDILSKPPQGLLECLRSVHQTKWKLVRIRQEQSKSYKEVCSSVIEKSKFLIYEIRPHHSIEKGTQTISLRLFNMT